MGVRIRQCSRGYNVRRGLLPALRTDDAAGGGFLPGGYLAFVLSSLRWPFLQAV
jgi:hypothetical protein